MKNILFFLSFTARFIKFSDLNWHSIYSVNRFHWSFGCLLDLYLRWIYDFNTHHKLFHNFGVKKSAEENSSFFFCILARVNSGGLRRMGSTSFIHPQRERERKREAERIYHLPPLSLTGYLMKFHFSGASWNILTFYEIIWWYRQNNYIHPSF